MWKTKLHHTLPRHDLLLGNSEQVDLVYRPHTDHIPTTGLMLPTTFHIHSCWALHLHPENMALPWWTSTKRVEREGMHAIGAQVNRHQRAVKHMGRCAVSYFIKKHKCLVPAFDWLLVHDSGPFLSNVFQQTVGSVLLKARAMSAHVNLWFLFFSRCKVELKMENIEERQAVLLVMTRNSTDWSNYIVKITPPKGREATTTRHKISGGVTEIDLPRLDVYTKYVVRVTPVRDDGTQLREWANEITFETMPSKSPRCSF